jgi:hypothetical protein
MPGEDSREVEQDLWVVWLANGKEAWRVKGLAWGWG